MAAVWGSVLLALIVFAGVVCWSSVKGSVHVSRNNKGNDEILLKLSALFGWVRFNYEVPSIRFENLAQGFVVRMKSSGNAPMFPKPKGIERIGKDRIRRFMKETLVLLHHTVELRKWLKQSLVHAHVSEFRWHTYVGTGDAPSTAISTGIIWSIKGMLSGWLLNKMKLDTVPELNVVPQFNRKGYITEMDVRIHMRLGRLLLIALMLGYRVFKARDGLKSWYRVFFKKSKSSAPTSV